MKIEYTKVGDYLVPNLTLPHQEKTYGKRGMIRHNYLKEHRPIQYNLLKLKCELIPHLNGIDEQARTLHETIMLQQVKKNSPPPQGTMEWVQHMNSLRAIADDFVRQDLIYN